MKFKCTVCDYEFSRKEHRDRHVRSHNSERPYECNECGKGFARQDILSRHLKSHSSLNSKKRIMVEPRCNSACRACANSKQRCSRSSDQDGDKCDRCKSKGLECVVPSKRHARASEESDSPEYNRLLCEESAILDEPECAILESPVKDMSSSSTNYLSLTPITTPESDPSSLQFANNIINSFDDLNTLFTSLDSNFGFGGMDDFSFLFMDQTEQQPANDPVVESELLIKEGDSTVSFPETSRAFKRSSFVWHNPEPDASMLRVSSMLQGSGPHTPLPISLSPNFRVTENKRDSLLVYMSQASQEGSAFIRLPGADTLSLLVNTYFHHFQFSYPLIHMGTFNPDECPNLLLLAIVSAGATWYGHKDEYMTELGLSLLELTRKCLVRIYEVDNSSIRQLHVQQASLINYISLSWTGVNRNLEIAEAFACTITAMIRRGDTFTGHKYRTLESIMSEKLTTEEKWKVWAKQESRKAMAFTLYSWSSQLSLTYRIPETVIFSELELPVPHDEKLWVAQSAEEWAKEVGELSQSPTYKRDTPFLAFVANTLIAHSSLSKKTGEAVLTQMLVPSLAAVAKSMVAEYRQSRDVRDQIMTPHQEYLQQTTRECLLSLRQAEIESTLESVKEYCHKYVGGKELINMLFVEQCYQALFCPMGDVLKLVGRDDEMEMKRALPRLIKWYHSDDGRHAVWHAGQIVRIAELMIKSHVICMALPVILFHSAAVLWAFGVVDKLLKKAGKVSTTTNGVVVNGNLTRREMLNSQAFALECGNEKVSLAEPGKVISVIRSITEKMDWGNHLVDDMVQLLRALEACS
uniref:ARAD1C41536p n=1 Tax=Blastobotrys adeninivorans TaxID=409370 RepID=A0A060T4K9_BLAAD